MAHLKDFKRKYIWSSVDFDKWVKDQIKQARDAGFEISSATITHKLTHDIIIPNNIRVIQPIKPKRRLKLIRKQIF